MEDLISYGGDLRIIAIRNEIERVQQNLLAAGHAITAELEPTDFLNAPLARVVFAMHWPRINEKLQQLLSACQTAADQYFDGEALISKEIMDVNIAPVLAGSIAVSGSAIGLFREGEASARRIGSPVTVNAPKSLRELADRVLQLDRANQPRVQIEKYGNKYLVLIPGTQTWNPIALSNPLDFTSNLGAMNAPKVAASEQAVRVAMNQAGIGRGSEVLFAGHSQGGIIAANIAASHPRNFSVAAVVTFGAPIAQLENRLTVPTIALQHRNDLVPKLGVRANPVSENWVTVLREVETKNASNDLVAAHDISNYKITAKLADKSDEPGLKRIRERVVNFLGGHRGDVTSGVATNFELLRN